MLGILAAEHPDTVMQARVEDRVVGNHTFDRPFLDELDANHVRDELATTSRILTGPAGPAPTRFRPPYGRNEWHY
jgi:peptidoglycan/xylan/chitin deacetylase (PgdA/CDA1 family)